jgi:SWI/SNF-related matrix-associated actin-dependent regulator 1 of chromatin subfamily A
MEIIFSDGVFKAISTYDERRIPKQAGFLWSSESRIWRTTDWHKAEKLLQYADPRAQDEIERRRAAAAKEIELSKAQDADINIPVPAGLSYMPFQQAGVAYALNRANCLLADEMGLGKTIQAVACINADTSTKKVLVVCPASLRINWRRELERWLVRPMSIQVLKSGKDIMNDADITIINYDLLTKYEPALKNITCDLFIADEAHYAKTRTAARSKAFYAIAATAKKRLYLTGTPILNRPAELFHLVESLGFGESWVSFMQRYANGHHTKYGWDTRGASNLDELQERLRSTIMIRRMKADVLVDLPAKIHQVIHFPANGIADVLAAERAFLEKTGQELSDLEQAVRSAKKGLENAAAVAQASEKLSRAKTFAFTEMSRLRHETALAKAPLVVEHVRSMIENGIEKIVVFAHHRDVVDIIKNGLAQHGVVSLQGGDSGESKQTAVDRFQTDPNIRVFVGSIQAAGAGLTLTASSHVVFAELDWVPANLSQAEDRCHRIGQIDSVLVQHIVVEDSIDARLADVLVKKQEIIAQALDCSANEPAEPLSVMDVLGQFTEQKRAV